MTKRKILLIESDPKLAKMVEKFLGKADFEVSTSSDGLDGLQMASEVKPHLVLIDMKLDDNADGGFALGKSFRRDDDLSALPLVLMVPEEFHDESPKKVEAISKVFDGFLYKPFADSELKRVVENHTGFGVSRDTNLETLDKLLNDKSGKVVDPDLKNLVKDLRDKTKAESRDAGGARSSSAKSSAVDTKAAPAAKKSDAEDKVKALESEIFSKNKELAERDRTIAELTSKVEDMEMDQSLAIETVESEKKKLEERVAELKTRVLDLEETLADVSDKLSSVQSVVDAHKKKKERSGGG